MFVCWFKLSVLRKFYIVYTRKEFLAGKFVKILLVEILQYSPIFYARFVSQALLTNMYKFRIVTVHRGVFALSARMIWQISILVMFRMIHMRCFDTLVLNVLVRTHSKAVEQCPAVVNGLVNLSTTVIIRLRCRQCAALRISLAIWWKCLFGCLGTDECLFITA